LSLQAYRRAQQARPCGAWWSGRSCGGIERGVRSRQCGPARAIVPEQSSCIADASSPGWRRRFVSGVYRSMTSSAAAPCRWHVRANS